MFRLARVWLAHRRAPAMRPGQSSITMEIPDYDLEANPHAYNPPLPPMPPPPQRTWRRPPTPSTETNVYCDLPRERWLKVTFDEN